MISLVGVEDIPFGSLDVTPIVTWLAVKLLALSKMDMLAGPSKEDILAEPSHLSKAGILAKPSKVAI